jgi:predicted TIM-barrel fold metal-dependent hydrolase
MAVIDADAHVVETERTWEYMEEAESPFKPEVVVPKAGGDREYWLIEGRAFAKNTNIGKDTPDEAREVSNIATRLAHMDALAVDVHVLYPTIFLRPLTRRPEAEVALCRSYNRWLAETWRQGGGRLRWVVVPPVLSLDQALEEIHCGREHGACGVFMRAVEGDRRLSDPYSLRNWWLCRSCGRTGKSTPPRRPNSSMVTRGGCMACERIGSADALWGQRGRNTLWGGVAGPGCTAPTVSGVL